MGNLGGTEQTSEYEIDCEELLTPGSDKMSNNIQNERARATQHWRQMKIEAYRTYPGA